MAIRPILFNTEMVRAILDGRKRCTRRLVKTRRKAACGFYVAKKSDGSFAGVYEYDENESMFDDPLEPPYQPGDILYVRETWSHPISLNSDRQYVYRADEIAETGFENESHIWHPSIHMPKEAARIWLKVTDVRVERLQEITEDETFEEGLDFKYPCLRLTGDNYCDIDGPCLSEIKYCDMSYGELFGKVLWARTIKKSDISRYGWDANPWVWVIEFERCKNPGESEDE